MVNSEETLKLRLTEVGRKLGKPPTLVKEVLALLHSVEVCLSHVQQEPSKGVQKVLAPTLKALVSNELLRHEDGDVKVAVASCLSEILRITAPDVPYHDDQMKEAFHLIISSFEGLDDKSSPSYSKRASILDTFERLRLCVVMLDLEFDGFILEMFRHFIKAISDYHPETVFSCMENIMVRVIEESEVISSDLLFCILEAVRKDNKEVTPVACKLMTKVIGTCADKLRACIKMAVIAKGVSLTEYGDLINHLCDKTSAERVIQSENSSASAVDVVINASKSSEPMADTVKTAEETPVAIINSTENISTDRCTDLVTSNGNTHTKGDTLAGSISLQYPELSTADKASETITADQPSAVRSLNDPEGIKTDMKASLTVDENPLTIDGNLKAEKEDGRESITEPTTEPIIKKQGRKTKAKNCKKTTAEPKLDGNSSSDVKQLDILAESGKSSNEEVCTSPHQKSYDEAAEHVSLRPSENDGSPSMWLSGETKESADKINEFSQSRKVVFNSENQTSRDLEEEEEPTNPVSAVSNFEEEPTNPTGDASEVEASDSKVDVPVEETDAADDENLEGTAIISSNAVIALQEAIAQTMDVAAEEVETRVGKSTKRSGVQSNHTYEVERGPTKANDGVKTRGWGLGKAALQGHAVAAEKNIEEPNTKEKPAMKSVRDGKDLKGTPNKRIEDNKNENKDFGEELVGLNVKVWWPADRRYYEGIIESFNSAKKKHKVRYSDGEVENLVLKKERWEVINLDEVEHGPPKAKDDVKTLGPGFGKGKLQKNTAAAENNNKESTTTRKSAMKTVKAEKVWKGTPRTATKRKRIEENSNQNKDFGEELVGSNVKIWWPADKRYYNGVIESFDSAKKKHKVCYSDGEVEILVLTKERWEVTNPDDESDTVEESDHDTPEVAGGKRKKGEEVDGGTSRKRLERPLSSKSKSAPNKPSSKLRDDPKAGAKAKTISSKVERQSKGKGFKSAGKSRADVPLSSVAGKSKADKSRHADNSDAQYSGKSKAGGNSRTSIERKSDSKNSSLDNIETRSVKRNAFKGKVARTGDKNAGMKSAAESMKGFKSPKSNPRSTKQKAPEMVDSDFSESEDTEEAAEEQTQSNARETRSSKRKASVLGNEKKGGSNKGQKRTKGRRQ